MSWKTEVPERPAAPGRAIARPWSLALRLAGAFAVAASLLLLAATGLLYWALAGNLDREDEQYLGEKISILESLLRQRPYDLAELREEVERESQHRFYPPVLIRVTDGGRVIAQTSGMDGALPPSMFPPPVPFQGNDWHPETVTDLRGRPFDVVAVSVGATASPSIVQVGLDQAQEQDLLAKYRRRLWLVLSAGLAGAALLGYGIARRGLRPIRRMSAIVRAIGSDSLDRRIDPVGLPPELSSLAATFNDMLRRLEDSFARLSRFSADLAHELRTPINNVRGLAEVAQDRARAGHDCVELLGPCLDECQRLSRLIDNLLFLARAENPKNQIQRQRVSARRELETVRDFYEAAAAESGITIEVDGPPDATADLDRLLFQRALGNLLQNALAHTPPGGTVRLAAAARDGRLQITVSDTGRGIPSEHLNLVFERFHRVDTSRSKHTGGVGLGLAIVQSIAVLHGGDVAVASTVGEGSRFTLSFPGGPGRGGDQPEVMTPVS